MRQRPAVAAGGPWGSGSTETRAARAPRTASSSAAGKSGAAATPATLQQTVASAGRSGFAPAEPARGGDSSVSFSLQQAVAREAWGALRQQFCVPRVGAGPAQGREWCPSGGTLILAGPTGLGQTVTVLREPFVRARVHKADRARLGPCPEGLRDRG